MKTEVSDESWARLAADNEIRRAVPKRMHLRSSDL